MRDSITVYDAKFTVYSSYQALEKVRHVLKIGHVITEEDARIIEITTEDLHYIMSHDWELGKV